MEINELINLIENQKFNFGYLDDQEAPTLDAEVIALVYESNAEAFYAGHDKALENLITQLKEYGNNN